MFPSGRNKSPDHLENLNRIPPLDLSFKQIDSLYVGLSANYKPRGGRLKVIPDKGPKGKYLTAGIWLNNNYLQTTENLKDMIHDTLEYPNRVSWIDLSFNRIETISTDLIQFPNLKILYLHGNNIFDIQAVMVLRPITTLRTLTLHGNPIDGVPLYRAYIIKIVSSLVNLDFVTIAPRERDAPLPPGFADILEAPTSRRRSKSLKKETETVEGEAKTEKPKVEATPE